MVHVIKDELKRLSQRIHFLTCALDCDRAHRQRTVDDWGDARAIQFLKGILEARIMKVEWELDVGEWAGPASEAEIVFAADTGSKSHDTQRFRIVDCTDYVMRSEPLSRLSGVCPLLQCTAECGLKASQMSSRVRSQSTFEAVEVGRSILAGVLSP